jgi:hypothetical protein
MPRFFLNSIELYIIQSHILEIEAKLAAHDQNLHHNVQVGKGGKGKTTSLSSSSSTSPSSVSVGLLSSAVRYGLKRQLALLRARLKKEERLLFELSARQAGEGEGAEDRGMASNAVLVVGGRKMSS